MTSPPIDSVAPWEAWEADVVVSDGSTVHVRSIQPDDDERLVDLHSRLSPETIYRRFFSAHPRLSPEEVRRFTHVDHLDRAALVATAVQGALIAVARYDRIPGSESAEVAFVVDDAYQGRGVGTLLLEHLAAYARTRGVGRFVADTLFGNTPMREVFRRAGYAETSSFDAGVIHIALDLEPTAQSIAITEERDRIAVVRSIERLLRPASIAVFGASPRAGTIGHEVIASLLRGGFAGPVYPVNRSAESVEGMPAYSALADIPGSVDLVVVVVPAADVSDVIVQCGHKGVGGLVVITAGFAETGKKGGLAQLEMVQLAHSYGMRVIGPNCMGVINTAPGVSMNATFAPTAPVSGNLGLCSQSGGLGVAILGELAGRGLGLSTFVSMGNKADVSGNDLLRYWERDPHTAVALLYLESIGNPRAFRRIAERFSRVKPIVALKAGRSTAGVRSASSHTAALASPDAAVDALFRATGVIRVNRLEELFDTAAYLSTQAPPRGRRVAIVGNSGGPGTLAADACEARDLEVPTLSAQSQAALREFLSPDAAVGNPVDMVASASAEDYERAIATVAADEGIDAVLVIFTPPIVTRADDVAVAVARAAGATDKSVVANFLGRAEVAEALRHSGTRPVPQFSYPESAADALAHSLSYGRWKQRALGHVPDLEGTDRADGKRIVSTALAGPDRPTPPESGIWMDAVSASALLSSYGIAHLGAQRSVNAEDDVGVETIVGAIQDPAFGPLVLFGAGGTLAELIADHHLASAPLTDVDAAELIAGSRVARMLSGWRGAPRADLDALVEVLLRVSQMVVELPEVAELDLNPVLASATGAVALDFKVRVAPSPSHPELSVRRLR
jgi:acetyl coenzyme A synthetase (ADP forming)-like protein